MNYDLTEGKIVHKLLRFAFPIMVGNLLQQLYNVVDTLIVGRYLGENALAAVGSAYTLMVFLTSIIIGLCMGSSAFFSIQFGSRDQDRLEKGIYIAFLSIGLVALVLNAAVYLGMGGILIFLRVPVEVTALMREYLVWIFAGIVAVFLYNFVANLLRAVGNSVVPLYFLGSTALLNVVLDLVFVTLCSWGIAGAAAATVIAQAVSGLGLMAYTWIREPQLRFHLRPFTPEKGAAAEILRFSFSSSVQQSVMNFGILMIQGLVNSFGAEVMAAFAAAVKIDSFAYMPAQEFGNAFSLFISQNHGAGEKGRVREGMRSAVKISMLFCIFISLLVFLFAPYLMLLFISPEETGIIAIGSGYLRVEGAFYCGIGILFLLYGYYRGINRPEMSLVLTVISLGTRVLLAYILAPLPQIGVPGIWSAIPIGWILADVTGILYLRRLEGSSM